MTVFKSMQHNIYINIWVYSQSKAVKDLKKAYNNLFDIKYRTWCLWQ